MLAITIRNGKVLSIPQPTVKLHVYDVVSDDEVLEKMGNLKSNLINLEI